MKAMIDGAERDVKTVENLGFQGGYLVKAVMFEGEERIVIKKAGVWQTRTSEMRLHPR